MTESATLVRSPSFVFPAGVAGDAQEAETDATALILARARGRAPDKKPGFAGNLTPQEAWELISANAAVLIDVRTTEERQFVGRIPESIHVPFLTGTAMQRNPRFVREVEARVKRDDIVLLLCRSGSRSAAAAQALAESRFTNAFNILEGFEGELNEQQQRGGRDGWRFRGLPWIQD